jgi:hypothetical protein
MKKKRGAHRPRLPERPFLTGTWSFPFSAGVRGRTVLLAVLAFVVGVLVRESLRLMASADGRLSFLGAMFTVLTVFAFVTWFAVAGACALAVVGDTANGCDRIVRWPTAAFLDWIGETFVIATAVGISVAPLVGRVLQGVSCCCFAYGQTGSGKTFTMEGVPEQRGINYCALGTLFDGAAARLLAVA